MESFSFSRITLTIQLKVNTVLTLCGGFLIHINPDRVTFLTQTPKKRKLPQQPVADPNTDPIFFAKSKHKTMLITE